MGAFLDRLAPSGLKPLFSLWCVRRPPGGVPPRDAFQMWDIPPDLLSRMFLYEREGKGYRCRLFGTTLVSIFGEEATGRTLAELVPAPALPTRQALFDRVLETRLPLLYEGRLVARNREWRRFSRLMLPVAKGGQCTMILGAITFPPAHGLLAEGGGPEKDLEWVEATEAECQG